METLTLGSYSETLDRNTTARVVLLFDKTVSPMSPEIIGLLLQG